MTADVIFGNELSEKTGAKVFFGKQCLFGFHNI